MANINTSQNNSNQLVLLSTRLRFSSHIQPIKQEAIDRLVEQAIFISSKDKLTNREIIQTLKSVFKKTIISDKETRDSLKRLIDRERVVEEKNSYRLDANANEEISKLSGDAQSQFSSVFKDLFDEQEYFDPFVSCICSIFFKLGEAYVRLILGKQDKEKFLGLPEINSCVHITSKKHKIDASVLKVAVNKFFEESHPNYNSIKWNLAQNYYIALTLGLDPHGQSLSKDIFEDTIFILDTNVLIQALEPLAPDYDSFQILLKACERLSAKIGVCNISVEELQDTIHHYEVLIKQVENEIPDQTSKKVEDVFFQVYLQKKEDMKFEEIFGHFKNPTELLFFNKISLVNDGWFNTNSESEETKRLAIEVQKQFELYSSRKKRIKQSIHDALILQWVAKERENSKVWLVTKDRSLPTIEVKQEKNPIAITLDALIQWISPIASEYLSMDDLSSVFADALKRQLLPNESFFKLEDFKVMAELELDCKQLPDEDVENCIKYIKKNVPFLDPSKAEDREKIGHLISTFFASPSRKYKQEIDSLKRSHKEKDEQIANLNQDKLRQQTFTLVTIGITIFLIIGVFISYLLWPSGKQFTLLDKINQLLPTHTYYTMIYFTVFGLMLGKKRLGAIGLWPKNFRT